MNMLLTLNYTLLINKVDVLTTLLHYGDHSYTAVLTN